MKKIQPIISDKAYDAIMYMRKEQRATITAIVEAAVKEYAEKHCPDALKEAPQEIY